MIPQWKLMYHRPKDEDHDNDEAQLLHWERGSFLFEHLILTRTFFECGDFKHVLSLRL